MLEPTTKIGDKQIHNPPIKSGCGGCVNYVAEDGSCKKTVAIAHGMGKYAYKKCKFYELPVEQKFAQVDCPYCQYVSAIHLHICQQMDSPRYSETCELCVWYKQEYPDKWEKEVSKTTTHVIKTGISHGYVKPTEKITPKETIIDRVVPEKEVQKIASHQPISKHKGTNEELKEKIARLIEEKTRNLQKRVSEYETRIKVVDAEHKIELQNMDITIEKLNAQVNTQKAEIDRLQLENHDLRAELSRIIEQNDRQKNERHGFARIFRFWSRR